MLIIIKFIFRVNQNMNGKFTAYVTSGPVFNTCEAIAHAGQGLFSKEELDEFNEKSAYNFGAIEILCHLAPFGKVYRIEYNYNGPKMRCS